MFKLKKTLFAFGIAITLSVTGCANMNTTEKSTLIGATTGAAIGNAIGDSSESTVI